MSPITLTPEGGVTDALAAADRGITTPRVPRPPVFIPAAEYLARMRADTDPSG